MNKLLLIFNGAPCSGKGSQSAFIANRYNFLLIELGSIIRNEIEKKSYFGLFLYNIIKNEFVLQFLTKVISFYTFLDFFLFFLLSTNLILYTLYGILSLDYRYYLLITHYFLWLFVTFFVIIFYDVPYLFFTVFKSICIVIYTLYYYILLQTLLRVLLFLIFCLLNAIFFSLWFLSRILLIVYSAHINTIKMWDFIDDFLLLLPKNIKFYSLLIISYVSYSIYIFSIKTFFTTTFIVDFYLANNSISYKRYMFYYCRRYFFMLLVDTLQSFKRLLIIITSVSIYYSYYLIYYLIYYMFSNSITIILLKLSALFFNLGCYIFNNFLYLTLVWGFFLKKYFFSIFIFFKRLFILLIEFIVTIQLFKVNFFVKDIVVFASIEIRTAALFLRDRISSFALFLFIYYTKNSYIYTLFISSYNYFMLYSYLEIIFLYIFTENLSSLIIFSLRRFPKSTKELFTELLKKSDRLYTLYLNYYYRSKRKVYIKLILDFIRFCRHCMLRFYDFMYHVYNIKRALDLPPEKSLDDMFWEQVEYYALPLLHFYTILSLGSQNFKLFNFYNRYELFTLIDELDEKTSLIIATNQTIHDIYEIKRLLHYKYIWFKNNLTTFFLLTVLYFHNTLAWLYYIISFQLNKIHMYVIITTYKIIIVTVIFVSYVITLVQGFTFYFFWVFILI